MRLFTAPAIAVAIALSLACARRPTRELEDAHRHLAEAEKAQASFYARSSYEEARKSLSEAERLAGERKYEDARVVALESVSHSRSAVGITAENKKKMLEALKLNLDSTARDLTEAEREITLAASRQIDAPTIDLFRRDILGARGKLQEAERLRSAGDIPAGRKWSDDARIAVDMLLREIRFSVAQRPITHPPAKNRHRSAPTR